MQCPKCHRPLADDSEGAYICCAGASLRWRCEGCAKVSEGFALPYGLCPQCGGKLVLLEPGAPGPDEAALTAVRMAFEIELGGRAFYQRAAADADDPLLKALFGRFALMEGEHMETLARRYHLDVPEPSPAFRLELAAIFAEVQSRPQDPANLFRIAVALEQRAAAFFAERADRFAPGSPAAQLFLELAAEEREHADLLATEFKRWADGRPGLFSHDLLGAPLMPEAAATADAAGASLNAAETLLAGHDDAATALVCGSASISRGALRQAVARAASAWHARGIGPGDKVAIKLEDGIDWVVAFLGTIWAGAVAVAVNPRIPAPEWLYILDEAGFKLILADRADDTPAPWRGHLLDPGTWRRECDAGVAAPARRMAPDAPAYWCHSSGTSGKPKAVVHGHRFATRIDIVSRERLGIGAGDRLYASSKLFFAYPQANSLFAGLKLGATVILDPRWPTPEVVLEIVQAQRPSVLFSVPSMLRSLLHDGHAGTVAAAGVRLCVSAGEALPASLRQAWCEATGLPLVNGYGASEVLVLAMTDDGSGLQVSPGHTVVPLSAVAPGQPTRLAITSPTVALGYLDRPQAQAEAFHDGAFCPADLFVAVADGRWRFAGREDALVKIRGRWVNLVELEQSLVAQAPIVTDAAAVCVADEDGVDALALFYVADDHTGAKAALAAHIATLPPFQRPRWLHPVDALPRTPTGKLLRRRLRELHLESGPPATP